MKLHRFIGEYDLFKKEVEISNVDTVKQIKNVLRLKNGDKIILSNGKGQEAEVVLNFISANKIIGIIEKINTKSESEEIKRKANLYLAILKKRILNWRRKKLSKSASRV